MRRSTKVTSAMPPRVGTHPIRCIFDPTFDALSVNILDPGWCRHLGADNSHPHREVLDAALQFGDRTSQTCAASPRRRHRLIPGASPYGMAVNWNTALAALRLAGAREPVDRDEQHARMTRALTANQKVPEAPEAFLPAYDGELLPLRHRCRKGIMSTTSQTQGTEGTLMDQLWQAVTEIIRLVRTGSKETGRTVRAAVLMIILACSFAGVSITLAYVIKSLH